jgi:hypothetical protein
MRAGQAPASLRKRRWLYLGLLAVQTVCVTVLVFELMPFFWRVVDDLGEVQPIATHSMAVACLCVVVFQACYWWRLKHLAVPFSTKSQLASHLFQFFGRLSFVFASTLASLIFFRHMPSIQPADLSVAGVFRLALFFAVLFSWFCFAVELERLGKRQPKS